MKSYGWVTAGSVLSAAASSACCWLPLLMVATGASAVGAAALVERFRVPFLIGAGVLLALGFYLNYRPDRERCDLDGSCRMPSPRTKRLNRGMLWLSAGLVVLFVLFPSYIGSLLATAETAEAKAGATERLVLGIEGMTCAGCEARVSASLEEVPGVRSVAASYADGRAVVDVDTDQVPTHAILAAAIGKAGYALTSVADDSAAIPADTTPVGQWTVDLPTENEGETIEVVLDVGRLNDRWVGEFDLVHYRVENYPVEVVVSGNEVQLFLTATGMAFKGAVSADGNTLAGTGTTRGDEETIVFTRTNDAPQFSSDFLELEAAADDPSLVERLSPEATALRERFNADSGRARLIALLSPT